MTEQPEQHQPTTASLTERLAKLGNAPPSRISTTGRAPAKRQRERTAAKPDARLSAAQAEAEAKDVAYPERLSITTTAAQIKALRMARADDGIQATARLRALIAAWMEDSAEGAELRERINRAARDWQ